MHGASKWSEEHLLLQLLLLQLLLLCCAVLCCAVLCCAVLCCAALRCTALSQAGWYLSVKSWLQFCPYTGEYFPG